MVVPTFELVEDLAECRNGSADLDMKGHRDLAKRSKIEPFADRDPGFGL